MKGAVRRWIVVLIIGAALALLLGRWASMVFAEWTWFDALGALPVYRSALAHRAAWRVGAGATAFLFAFLNLYALRKSIVSLVLPRRLGNIEIGEAVSAPTLLAIVFGVAVVLAALLSSPTGSWTTFALARIAGPFHEMDPFLDRDLSWVTTWLPFESDLYDWAGRCMVTVSVLIVVLYALTPSLRVRRRGIYVSAYCRRHLSSLAAIGILLLAWRARLDALSATSLGADSAHPFGAYDQSVGVPLLIWVAGLSVVGAFVVFWAGWHGHTRFAALAGLVLCVGAPVAEVSLPGLTDRTLTEAERAEQDRPYAATRILFTRRAFGVDEIRDSARSPVTTLRDLARLAPVWDPIALARSATPLAAATSGFGTTWSADPGGLRTTVLTPLPGGAGAWSATDFDVTESDERGRALPAVRSSPGSTSPSGWSDVLLYPGAPPYAVIADSAGRIPAPGFATRQERIAQAWNLRAPRLLAADPSIVRPKLVSRRDVRDRISALAPFLTIGPTISPLIRGDSLYWVAELFTTPPAYPLSERFVFAGRYRPYVHHAATAFVQSATGRVTFVATRTPDGIMRAWMRRFPWLFISPDDAPSALIEAHGPASDWAALQAVALAHTGRPGTRQPAPLAVATDNADADLLEGSPTLFAGTSPGFWWSEPLLDASGAVTGVVAATGGAEEHTVWIPAARRDRWADILDRLQHSADSAGLGKQRPNARRGRVLTVPVAGGFTFLQAHYEWAPDAPPMLAGVSALAGGVSRAAPTLAEALGVEGLRRRPTSEAFRSAVDGLYRRMDDALRRGDLPAFGVAFRELGQLVRTGGR